MAKHKPKEDRRVFTKAAKQAIIDARSGKTVKGATRKGLNLNQEARAAAGGRLPDRLFKQAREGKLSRPVRKKKPKK